jgi:hypothetical protein
VWELWDIRDTVSQITEHVVVYFTIWTLSWECWVYKSKPFKTGLMSAVTANHNSAPIARRTIVLRFTENIATVKTANIHLKNFIELNRKKERLIVKNCKYFHFITLRAIDVHFIILYRFLVGTNAHDRSVNGIHESSSCWPEGCETCKVVNVIRYHSTAFLISCKLSSVRVHICQRRIGPRLISARGCASGRYEPFLS